MSLSLSFLCPTEMKPVTCHSTSIPEPQGDNGWEGSLRGRAGTVLLMDMLDEAHARCTLGQYASSSLLVILLSYIPALGESKIQIVLCSNSPFSLSPSPIPGMEKVGPRGERRPASGHRASSSTAPIFRLGSESSEQICEPAHSLVKIRVNKINTLISLRSCYFPRARKR